jgi:deoxyribodipyrimidine photolyase-like uncharacterized protein
VLLIESRAAFGRRPVHRQRAHLVLSALRHRAAELGGQATLVRARTYREALATVDGELTVCGPTSMAADRFVRDLPHVTVLPSRGFATSAEEFADWARERGRRRLLLEDFYRDARVRLRVLMDGGPAGGRWNFDADNREPPPGGLNLPRPPPPAEDDIDRGVRLNLDEWQRSGQVRLTGRDGDRGYAHHIIRLMVLGNYALQRGWDPAALTGWFHANFVDGYDWVMVPNVMGMSQYADGGLMATKPYPGGGAYINRMSDYCGDCAYRPAVRLGPQACPLTAGYWAFIDRHATRFAANPRMARQVRGATRLADLARVAKQERRRGAEPP